jgi:ABC-type oligopeptide transport system substrate-binding subunit
MFRKLWLAVVAATIAAALLVGATFAADSTAVAGSAEAKRGGTIRVNVSNSDFAFVDPALAYDTLSWSLLYATNMTLLNYPDKPAPEGSRLVPDAAVAFPRVSRDGRTYTFTIRKGLRFSDGSAVTARNFAHAIHRAAHPRQASPAIAFLHDVVGADELNEGKASRVTGVTAKGRTLTIRLERPSPTFLAQIAMPFFAAVKTNMGLDPRGSSVYPSAGPYRIASREIGRQVVLERNPYYRGSRPANADRIVYTVNTDSNQSLLQVRAGQADYDLSGLPPSAHDELSRSYGVRKGGNGRYFVNPRVGVQYLALNTSRPGLSRLAARKAVNFAIDRPALVRMGGKLAAKRTDQILAPGMRGFRDQTLYPLKGADPAAARKVLGGRARGELVLLHSSSGASVGRAQVIQYNLRQVGWDVTLKPQPFAVSLKTAGTKGGDFDIYLHSWLADYPDPYDFVNVLLDGDGIQESNNLNFAYLSSSRFNKAMQAAARMSGDERYDAYGKLDLDLMRGAAPWAPYANPNVREFVSSRVTNYVFHPIYSSAAVTALALKR